MPLVPNQKRTLSYTDCKHYHILIVMTLFHLKLANSATKLLC